MTSVQLSRLQENELELLVTGAYPSGSYVLPDGNQLAATLRIATEPASDQLELLDHQNTPIARVTITGTRPVSSGGFWIAGEVDLLQPPTPGAFSELRLAPASGPVKIVVDHGVGSRLARSVRLAKRDGGEIRVLPEPAAAHVPAGARDEFLKQLAHQIWGDAIVEVVTEVPPSGGLVVFFTGLSGSGKSTLGQELVQSLAESDPRVATLLDGDEVRQLLSAGLGFSKADRDANIRRIGWVAALLAEAGAIAVCAPIAPYAEARQQVRELVEERGGRFVLIHVATPLKVCEARDRKGLYALARAGKLPEFTGISDPYETPLDADLTIDTSTEALGESIRRIRQLVTD